MINLSAVSTSAKLGQSSTIQGQSADGGMTSSQGFPPLAGFGSGGQGSGGLLPAPLPGWGSGGAARGEHGLAAGSDFPEGQIEAQIEGQVEGQAAGQTPQLLEGGALAGAAVDAAVLPPGYGVPGASAGTGASTAGFVGADTAPASGADSKRGFPSSALVMGSPELSSRASFGSDGLRLAQAQVHSQNQSPSQGQSQHYSPALSQNHSQISAHELGRLLTPLMGNAGSPAAPLRATADMAALMSAQGTQAESALLAVGSARTGAGAIPEWSPVRIDAQQAHWGRDLMAALAERVEMQISQQIKQARIRLDPPELGRLQLTVRLDGDRLSVQLNASHPQVREALAHQQDRLRADLAGEYGQGVDGSVGQEQGQQRSPAGDQPWDLLEMGIETALAVVDGDLDKPGADQAIPNRDDKDWVSALV